MRPVFVCVFVRFSESFADDATSLPASLFRSLCVDTVAAAAIAFGVRQFSMHGRLRRLTFSLAHSTPTNNLAYARMASRFSFPIQLVDTIKCLNATHSTINIVSIGLVCAMRCQREFRCHFSMPRLLDSR